MKYHQRGQPILIIGVRDQELRSIENIIRDMQIPGYYALRDGRFVSAINAYDFNGLRQFSGPTKSFNDYAQSHDNRVIFVECFSQTISDQVTRQGYRQPLRIDHHHEGDVGFDIPPERFLFGSSIGQFINEIVGNWSYRIHEFGWYCNNRGELFDPGLHYCEDLGYNWIVTRVNNQGYVEEAVVPDWVLYVAAADHCLGAAYQGHCPGVNPQELMIWRSQHRAQYKNQTYEDIEEVIEQTRQQIRPFVVDGVADLTRQPMTIYPELPEAAAREGIRVITKVRDRTRRQPKLLTMGYGPPQDFHDWIEQQRNLGREVYGSPHRGYAGSFLREDEVSSHTTDS